MFSSILISVQTKTLNFTGEIHDWSMTGPETLEVTPGQVGRHLGTRNHIAGHPGRCMEVIAVACLEHPSGRPEGRVKRLKPLQRWES